MTRWCRTEFVTFDWKVAIESENSDRELEMKKNKRRSQPVLMPELHQTNIKNIQILNIFKIFHKMMLLKIFILTIVLVAINGQRVFRQTRQQQQMSTETTVNSNTSHAALRKIRVPKNLCTHAICGNCQRALSLQIYEQNQPEAKACVMLLTQQHCCHHSGRLYNGMLF